MKRIVPLAAAVLAAAFLFALSLLPPSRAKLPPPGWQAASPIVSGVMHLHTRRSDGSGTPDEVADVILFLCEKGASYVSGAEIQINGGQHV